MSPLRKSAARELAAREEAKSLLSDMPAGSVDEYVGYRHLYGLWCSNNSAVQELRPLFRMPGVAPDGTIHVTAEFRAKVLELARRILPKF